MALVLQIIYPEHLNTLQEAKAVFEAKGGYIGRSDDNTWIIYDDHKHFGRRHAKIAYHPGEGYHFVDHSTNGTYIRRKGTLKEEFFQNEGILLGDGDIICVGEYEIGVEVSEEFGEQEDFASPVDPSIPSDRSGLDAEPLSPPLRAVPIGEVEEIDRRELDDCGESAFFHDTDGHVFQPVPPSEYVEREAPEPHHQRSSDVAPPEEVYADEPLPPLSHLAIEPVNIKPEYVKNQAAETVVPSADSGANDFLVDALLEGLGLDPARVELTPELAYQLGQTLRESVAGVIKLMEVRSRFKFTVGLEVTRIKSRGMQNALKVTQSPEIAIETLVLGRPGYMNMPDSIAEAFSDSETHLLAMGGAIQSSMANTVDLIDRMLSPQAIDNLLQEEKALLRTDGRRWKTFEERYKSIDISDMLSNDLENAYSDQVEKLLKKK